MKGLFLKEFYNIKDDIHAIIILEVVLLGIYIFINTPFADLITGFIVFIGAASTYLRCEMLNYKNNFNMYEKTLPLNLNKIILSKYLFMFLLMFIIVSISFIISLFFKEDVEILNTLKYSLVYIFFINFSLIYVPVSYLFFILLKGNIVGTIFANMLGLFLSMFLNILCSTLLVFFFSKSTNVIIEKLPMPIIIKSGLLNFVFSFIIMFIIYKLTCFLYKKQSL